MSTTPLLPVTQADRDRAAHYYGENSPTIWPINSRLAICAGSDDENALVQAFAAHRIEAEARLSASRDGLEEAIFQAWERLGCPHVWPGSQPLAAAIDLTVAGTRSHAGDVEDRTFRLVWLALIDNGDFTLAEEFRQRTGLSAALTNAPRKGTQEPESGHERYITLWRKPDNVLDWDFHVSENMDDARMVISNIKAEGAHQYSTYLITDRLADLSSEY